MSLELTAVFRKVSEGYVGFVEELPGDSDREELPRDCGVVMVAVEQPDDFVDRLTAARADIQREKLIEPQLVKESKWHFQPGAVKLAAPNAS